MMERGRTVARPGPAFAPSLPEFPDDGLLPRLAEADFFEVAGWALERMAESVFSSTIKSRRLPKTTIASAQSPQRMILDDSEVIHSGMNERDDRGWAGEGLG